MVDVGEISRLWRLACEDAEYEPDTQVVLYVLPGDSGDGAAALHLEPGHDVVATSAWPLAPNQIADANGPARRNGHRIFVRDFTSSQVALGRLRHELEHARQYDQSPQVYLAMTFARDSLSRAFEERKPPSLRGSAALYNVLPPEEDANRASARLVAAVLGDPSDEDLAGTDAPLFRDPSPVDRDTLGLRVLAFAGLFPEGIAWIAEQRGEKIDDLLDRLGPGARVGWGAMQTRPEIAHYGQAALAACPSEEAIDAAPNPADAWTGVKGSIEEGKEVAEIALKAMSLDLF